MGFTRKESFMTGHGILSLRRHTEVTSFKTWSLVKAPAALLALNYLASQHRRPKNRRFA
jgi:hypothetical protein